jgi:hypothetical protein
MRLLFEVVLDYHLEDDVAIFCRAALEVKCDADGVLKPPGR